MNGRETGRKNMIKEIGKKQGEEIVMMEKIRGKNEERSTGKDREKDRIKMHEEK